MSNNEDERSSFPPYFQHMGKEHTKECVEFFTMIENDKAGSDINSEFLDKGMRMFGSELVLSCLVVLYIAYIFYIFVV